MAMVLWYSRYTKRAMRGLVCLGVIFFLLLLHSFQLLNCSARRYDTWTWTTSPRTSIAQNTLVVVKTGGSEPQSRLHSQLATVLSKIPNVIIFSDMEEQVGTHYVYDAYADISEQERADYPEFALYDAQQEHQRQGKDTRAMAGGWNLGGWDLAKYMNLAMKRKLWTMQPEISAKQWFVFIDTDTFIEWNNLFSLLEHLNAARRLYIGSPVWLPGGLQFAHGGSAYVLSYTALKALNDPGSGSRYPSEPLYSQFGLNTTALCCGDEALARALKSKGVDVNLKGYWPMFNGETPATVSFGRDTWCEPVISLHHLNGEEMQRLWQWIEEWKTKHEYPLLFKDLFHYIAPRISDVLEDWDNTDDGMKIYSKERAAHTSFGNCKAACEADELCFQFVHDGTTCALSHHIRLGRKRSSEEHGKRKYMSGWRSERIQAWIKKNNCASAHWVRSNP